MFNINAYNAVANYKIIAIFRILALPISLPNGIFYYSYPFVFYCLIIMSKH